MVSMNILSIDMSAEPSSYAETDAPGQSPAEPVNDRRLSGDITMWFVIALEMLTFGLLFVVYAVARAKDPLMFRAGQSSLDLHLGAINTVILLSGSWCVARGSARGTSTQSGSSRMPPRSV